MIRMGPFRQLASAIALAVVVITSPALAQERYTLDEGRWQAIPGADPASPEGQIQAIRKTLAQGEAGRAERLATDWIRAHANNPLLPEAHLLRGDALVARSHYYKALFDYEAIIRLFPGSPQFQTALEREFEIARLYTGGVRRHFLGMRILPARGEGEELFIRIQERAPGSEIGERASMALADYYFSEGRMDLAAEAYDLFLQNYPRSEHREWAMLRLIQASLARFQGPEYDPTGLIEAAQRLRTYQEEYPAAADRLGAPALLTRIQESLALKDFVTARWYERRGRDVSAAYTYQRIVQDFPQTAAAQQALQRIDALGIDIEP